MRYKRVLLSCVDIMFHDDGGIRVQADFHLLSGLVSSMDAYDGLMSRSFCTLFP